MRTGYLFFATCLALAAQALPGTAPLEVKGDLAAQMVQGIIRHLERATADSAAARRPDAARLRYILGAVDSLTPFRNLSWPARWEILHCWPKPRRSRCTRFVGQ